MSDRLLAAPAGELYSNRIDAGHSPAGICDNHAIADGIEGRGQVLLAFPEFLFPLLSFADVRGNPACCIDLAIGQIQGEFDGHIGMQPVVLQDLFFKMDGGIMFTDLLVIR